MTSTGLSIIWGGVAAAVITALAGIGSAIISRQIKISEFRQAWINALRDDITEYISKVDEWMDAYEDFNSTVSQDEKKSKVQNVVSIRYVMLKVLRRIELRFNPNDNRYKAEDDAFLASLRSLIDLGKIPPDPTGGISRSAWNSLVDRAVLRARHILKREWEVTKRPLTYRFKRSGQTPPVLPLSK